MTSKRKKIAIIGSGIAGLSAAWLLSKNHDVTVFESENRLGGHTNTININTPEGSCPVDTGFIVYNPPNYPNLVALFDHLNVSVKPTKMSFAASLRGASYEYSGNGLSGLFGQPSNILNPSHWMLLRDLVQFFNSAASKLDTLDDSISLGDFLKQGRYGKSFIDNHLLPMAAAIWSSPAASVMNYPASAFIRFFDNHGLLKLTNRPPWMTVDGGANTYIDKLCDDGDFDVRVNHPISSIHRRAGKVIVKTCESNITFDDVVLAVHADQALSMISEPSPEEYELLGAFTYTNNLTVVHSDSGFMPNREKLWSSWNYIERGQKNETAPFVSYWMNSLQNLPTSRNIFVTLNPDGPIRPDHYIAKFQYQHPVFDTRALLAQKRLWDLQANGHVWFCGSYFGAGFHEDALQSGLAVAEELGGGARPWRLELTSPSNRIYVRPRVMPLPLEAA